jgi:hypothetical protein
MKTEQPIDAYTSACSGEPSTVSEARFPAWRAWWPLPMIRNYSEDASLTRLFLRIAAQPDLAVVDDDGYRTTVSCSLGRLSFWSENRYYAWAHSGTWEPAFGSAAEWRDAMPSRGAVRAMRRAIEGLAPEPNQELRAAVARLFATGSQP